MGDSLGEPGARNTGIGCGISTESSYEIAPLSPTTWDAFEALVQRRNGIFGGCWCTRVHPGGPERGQGAEANRALKKTCAEQCKAHATLVMDGVAALSANVIARGS